MGSPQILYKIGRSSRRLEKVALDQVTTHCPNVVKLLVSLNVFSHAYRSDRMAQLDKTLKNVARARASNNVGGQRTIEFHDIEAQIAQVAN